MRLAALKDVGEVMSGLTALDDRELDGLDAEHVLWALEQVAQIANLVELLQARFARRIERSGVWTRRGERTGEAFVAKVIGATCSEATRLIDHAAALEDLPLLAAAQ